MRQLVLRLTTALAISSQSFAADLNKEIPAADWVQSLAAVVSLSRNRSESGDRILAAVSKDYWLPVVREAARNALLGRPHLPSYGDVGLDNLISPARRYCEAQNSELRAPAALQSGRTQEEIYQLNAWNQRNFDRYVRRFQIHPDLRNGERPGLSVEQGGVTLVGTNHGEFGGKVVAMVGGKTVSELNENAVAVFVFQGKLMAITGLNHMITNYGNVYQFKRNPNGEYRFEQKLRLVGSPLLVLVAETAIGFLSSEGSMIVDASGSPKWLECAPPQFGVVPSDQPVSRPLPRSPPQRPIRKAPP